MSSKLYTVFITGASQGIGKVLSQSLKDKGHKVIGSSTSKEHILSDIRLLELNLLDRRSVENCVERLKELYQNIDIVVLNASIGFNPDSILNIKIKDLEDLYTINVFNNLALFKALVASFKIKKVIFIGSIMANIPLAYYAPYATAKSSFELLAKALRVELSGFGVEVGVVSPNLTSTNFSVNRKNVGIDEDPKSDYIKRLNVKSLRHADTPQRVADTVIRAIESRHLKAHYYVGIKGYATACLLKLLPDSLILYGIKKLFRL